MDLYFAPIKKLFLNTSIAQNDENSQANTYSEVQYVQLNKSSY